MKLEDDTMAAHAKAVEAGLDKFIRTIANELGWPFRFVKWLVRIIGTVVLWRRR